MTIFPLLFNATVVWKPISFRGQLASSCGPKAKKNLPPSSLNAESLITQSRPHSSFPGIFQIKKERVWQHLLTRYLTPDTPQGYRWGLRSAWLLAGRAQISPQRAHLTGSHGLEDRDGIMSPDCPKRSMEYETEKSLMMCSQKEGSVHVLQVRGWHEILLPWYSAGSINEKNRQQFWNQ